MRAIVAHDGGRTGLGGHWQTASAARQVVLERLYLRLLAGGEAIGALPTPYALPLERFDGAVLFWEEVGGRAAHVWSLLHVLRHCGILERISGLVVGVRHEIDGLGTPGDGSATLRETVLDVLGDRDIPVLGKVEFGHAGSNLPMPVGVRAQLDAGQRTLSLFEPAVAASSFPDLARASHSTVT
ncbi:hypothetical protein [Streptomyces sp. 3213.3]|uniref:hypothetical protein n=1 Tax=Streptomyces sp. 3213.3 TaxID=1855348 RepID=UPI000A55641E|nr:hypothetical protein [Streptomyces sp. 3213.3]